MLVGNVGQLEAGIPLLPDAAPDWPVLAGRILAGRSASGRQADILRGRRVRIVAERPVPYEFDGDFVGERSELEVEVLPGALLLRCPKR